MLDLTQSLQGRDLGHLRIIAELWGIELSAPDARVGLLRLVPALLDKERLADVITDLPPEARQALDDLMRHGGLLPWAVFARRYGSVREMGPGRRDRDRPYLSPVSPAEALWYRALVGRNFLDTPRGPEEMAYIPEDLAALLPVLGDARPQPLGRLATLAERQAPIPANDRILDHACTVLAAMRLGQPIEALELAWNTLPYPLTPRPLANLLAAAGLTGPDNLPLAEPTRAFLEAPRGEALAFLARAWLNSTMFNELRSLPGLSAEGDWQNDPLRTRQIVLDLLSTLPGGEEEADTKQPGAGPHHASQARRPYWSLNAFVAAVRQAQPDFQRPAGDYDSWFLRDVHSGEFLRGFAHWDKVDGALLRYMITGPLHWLGIVDLAAPEKNAPAAAFRFSCWAPELLHGKAPAGLEAETEPVQVSSEGRLFVPRLAPRVTRYQIARFTEWEGESGGVYRYRVTPAALKRARQQGLRASHLLALLRRQAPSVSPSLARALERWEERGSEARLERLLVLRLSSPDLLQALRASRAGRFLGEPLGPTAVVVKPGAAEKVLAALAELGYLGELLD
jgi:hypothetical protein